MIEIHMTPITLRASRSLVAGLTVVHIAAAGLMLLLPLPMWLQAGVAIALLASAVHTVSHHAMRRGRHAITALYFTDREQLQLERGDGSRQAGRILDSSTVGAFLTVLNIALVGRRFNSHVVLLPDSLGFDDYRRLRVWLRWGPRAAGDEPVAEKHA